MPAKSLLIVIFLIVLSGTMALVPPLVRLSEPTPTALHIAEHQADVRLSMPNARVVFDVCCL